MSRSHELFAEALRYLPGGVNSPVRAFRAVGGEPFFAQRAYGARVEDVDGRAYIDYVGSWGPAILGHAPPAVIDVLNRIRGPFNVSSTAAAAGIAALADPNWVIDGRAHNRRAREKLQRQLEATGLKIHPSEANFLLLDFLTPERAAEADQYLRARGIILRHVKSYGLPSCLRVTIGTDEECDLVAENLTAFQRISQKTLVHG